MHAYRPFDDALLRAVLVGATPEQRAWLGGASGDQRQLDAADAAAGELFCRAMARAAQSQACSHTCGQAVDYVQRTLPRRRRQAVAAHLEGCSDCAWVIEMLPAVADAVGSVAAVYADTVVGPPEAPADALRRPVPTTAPPRRRKRAIAAVAAVAVALLGVGAAVARNRQADETSNLGTSKDTVTAAPVVARQPMPTKTPSPSSTPSQTPSPSASPEVTPSDAAELEPGQGVLRPAGADSPAPWGDSQDGAGGGQPPAGSSDETGAGTGGGPTGGESPGGGPGSTTPTSGPTPHPTAGGPTPRPTGGVITPGSGATKTPSGDTQPTPGTGEGPDPGGNEPPSPTSDPSTGTDEPGVDPGTDTPVPEPGTEVTTP